MKLHTLAAVAAFSLATFSCTDENKVAVDTPKCPFEGYQLVFLL